jgi:hypothetical protein
MMAKFETKIRDEFVVPKDERKLKELLNRHVDSIASEIIHKRFESVEIVTVVKEGKVHLTVRG